MMDIEKLIEQLNARGLSNGSSLGYHCGLYDEAATALTALRPVSREKVERMRGEWISTGAISCKCSSCNHLEPKYRVDEYNFCPYCMAPMTDEAVDMMLRPLKEVLKDAVD